MSAFSTKGIDSTLLMVRPELLRLGSAFRHARVGGFVQREVQSDATWNIRMSDMVFATVRADGQFGVPNHVLHDIRQARGLRGKIDEKEPARARLLAKEIIYTELRFDAHWHALGTDSDLGRISVEPVSARLVSAIQSLAGTNKEILRSPRAILALVDQLFALGFNVKLPTTEEMYQSRIPMSDCPWKLTREMSGDKLRIVKIFEGDLRYASGPADFEYKWVDADQLVEGLTFHLVLKD